jgi:hypothetical protein
LSVKVKVMLKSRSYFKTSKWSSCAEKNGILRYDGLPRLQVLQLEPIWTQYMPLDLQMLKEHKKILIIQLLNVQSLK